MKKLIIACAVVLSGAVCTAIAFTDTADVTICHENMLIQVDEASVPAHLDHGDKLGTCEDDPI